MVLLNLSIDGDLYAKLLEVSQEDGLSVQELVNKIFSQYLELGGRD